MKLDELFTSNKVLGHSGIESHLTILQQKRHRGLDTFTSAGQGAELEEAFLYVLKVHYDSQIWSKLIDFGLNGRIFKITVFNSTMPTLSILNVYKYEKDLLEA